MPGGLHVDLERLARTRARLEDASEALDRLGHRAPAGRDLGEAAALVAAALALGTEAAARIGAEARVLATAVALFGEDMSRTDAVAVTDLFRLGATDGAGR